MQIRRSRTQSSGKGPSEYSDEQYQAAARIFRGSRQSYESRERSFAQEA